MASWSHANNTMYIIQGTPNDVSLLLHVLSSEICWTLFALQMSLLRATVLASSSIMIQLDGACSVQGSCKRTRSPGIQDHRRCRRCTRCQSPRPPCQHLKKMKQACSDQDMRQAGLRAKFVPGQLRIALVGGQVELTGLRHIAASSSDSYTASLATVHTSAPMKSAFETTSKR